MKNRLLRNLIVRLVSVWVKQAPKNRAVLLRMYHQDDLNVFVQDETIGQDEVVSDLVEDLLYDENDSAAAYVAEWLVSGPKECQCKDMAYGHKNHNNQISKS